MGYPWMFICNVQYGPGAPPARQINWLSLSNVRVKFKIALHLQIVLGYTLKWKIIQ